MSDHGDDSSADVSALPPTNGSHVMTVRGPVAPEDIGLTSMHEHLFCDCATAWWDPAAVDDPDFAHARMTPRDGGRVRWNTFTNADNLRLGPEDYDVILTEVGDFKRSGGSCLVELSNHGLDPQPELLRRIAEELDLHIVEGCGFYVRDAHPEWLDDWSVEQIEERLHSELAVGVAGTGVRAGIIGEIGTSKSLHPVEQRVVEAAGRVGAVTGTTVNIHTLPPEQAVVMEIIDTLAAGGLEPSRMYFSHLDEIADVDYLHAVLERGVVIGFDSMGQDFYFAPRWKAKSDNERIAMIARLVGDGFEDQLVLGQDVCMKCMLKEFGGMGYDHLAMRVAPRLMDAFDVAPGAVDKMLIETPRRLLTRPGVGAES